MTFELLEYMKKAIDYQISEEKKSFLGWGLNPQKWDKTWRNLWRSKLEHTARVEIELTDFSLQTWFLNLILCLFQTEIFQATQAVKIKFEIDKKSS